MGTGRQARQRPPSQGGHPDRGGRSHGGTRQDDGSPSRKRVYRRTPTSVMSRLSTAPSGPLVKRIGVGQPSVTMNESASCQIKPRGRAVTELQMDLFIDQPHLQDLLAALVSTEVVLRLLPGERPANDGVRGHVHTSQPMDLTTHLAHGRRTVVRNDVVHGVHGVEDVINGVQLLVGEMLERRPRHDRMERTASAGAHHPTEVFAGPRPYTCFVGRDVEGCTRCHRSGL